MTPPGRRTRRAPESRAGSRKGREPAAALERPGRLREGPRPPLGSWVALYALVVLELAAFIALLAWLTRRFS